VIDLPQIIFKLPAKAGETGRGLIKAFRYGLVMQGGSRIVLDTKGPVRIDKAFVLAAADGQPARMVLDLAATDRNSFLRNAELEHHAARTQQRVTIPPASDDSRPLVVIDPGHGGIDNGTKATTGELEKSIVLDFATLLDASRQVLNAKLELLQAKTEAQMRLAEIALACGFADQSHFTRVFSQRVNVSPGVWRREQAR
jgi:N-acetylmuramoyl-L-alanine amidase